jgi:mutator protein MutT
VVVSRIVAIALLASGPRVLVVRRPSNGPLPDLWEFPGGKVEFGEHPWETVRRELREELEVAVDRGRLFGVYSHVYDLDGVPAHVVLVVYRISVRRDQIPQAEDRRWASSGDLTRLPVVPGSRPIVEDLLGRPGPGNHLKISPVSRLQNRRSRAARGTPTTSAKAAMRRSRAR